jgi:hypothetical protein
MFGPIKSLLKLQKAASNQPTRKRLNLNDFLEGGYSIEGIGLMCLACAILKMHHITDRLPDGVKIDFYKENFRITKYYHYTDNFFKDLLNISAELDKLIDFENTKNAVKEAKIKDWKNRK